MSRLIIGKPKRPISSYNIFYRLARKIMLSYISQGHDDPGAYTFGIISSMDYDSLRDMALSITQQYRDGVVEKDSRIKCLRLQGILKLKDLTRLIAAHWAKLSPSSRMLFEMCSNKDKKIYTELRQIWNTEKDAMIKRHLDQQVLQESNDSPRPSSSLNELSRGMIPSQPLSNTAIHSQPVLTRLISTESNLGNDCNATGSLPEVISSFNRQNSICEKECELVGLHDQRDLFSNTPVNMCYEFSVEKLHRNFHNLRETLLNEVFDDETDLNSFFSSLR